MGNIEDSSKPNLPPKKVASDREIKPPVLKKQYKTDIVHAIPSSRLNCKVSFQRFAPKEPPLEATEDDVP
jgi:hypothetical protein